MSNLIINIDNFETSPCCGNCRHNTTCDNFINQKHNDWLCGLYQSGGKSVKQLSLFGDDYD